MISIVTVCHNSRAALPEYIRSFLKHNNGHNRTEIEFVFVENSGDHFTEKFAAELQEYGFDARVIHTENFGFGAGCNAGAKVARGELLVLVNPDVRFDCNLALIQFYFEKCRWGTIRQTNSNGTIYAFDLLPEHRSVFSELVRPFKFLHRFPSLYRFCFPVGSFMIIPRGPFIEAGGFDERFFLYYEEAELSRRLRALLGQPTYCSELSVKHEGFGSQSNQDFTFREEARGMVTYSRVTGQHHLTERRVKTLRLLAPFSRAAGRRLAFLKNAVSAMQDKVTLELSSKEPE
jgi:GT2 family glycosyltransferase